jgi:DNA-binding Xre family transcriptional regulator
MTSISKNLETLMQERGISRQDLAKKAGINIHAVHNILQGKVKEPPATKLEAIARVLNVDIGYLLHGKNETKPMARPSPETRWDGVLYADAVMLVREICKKKNISLGASEKEAKDSIMRMADKIYRYCIKKNMDKVDPTFAEFVVEEGI